MRNSILPSLGAAVLGLWAVGAAGFLEWAFMIPSGLFPLWVFMIFNALLGSVTVLSIALPILHLRDLRRQRNPVES